jgi:hypothetical protein
VKSSESSVWFRVQQYQTTTEKRYLQVNLLQDQIIFFLGNDRSILKEGVKTFLMASMPPLNSPTFFRSTYVFYDITYVRWILICFYPFLGAGSQTPRVWNCQILNQVVESQLFTSLWNRTHQWLLFFTVFYCEVDVLSFLHWAHSDECFFQFLIRRLLLFHCWKAVLGSKIERERERERENMNLGLMLSISDSGHWLKTIFTIHI